MKPIKILNQRSTPKPNKYQIIKMNSAGLWQFNHTQIKEGDKRP